MNENISPNDRENMAALARESRGGITKHSELEPGDRFMIFSNQGRELCPTVYVHDLLDGIAYVHEQDTGKRAIMTGEMDVMKLPWKADVILPEGGS